MFGVMIGFMRSVKIGCAVIHGEIEVRLLLDCILTLLFEPIREGQLAYITPQPISSPPRARGVPPITPIHQICYQKKGDTPKII